MLGMQFTELADLDDVIFEIRQFMGGGISNEGVIKPAVAVTCGDCGNIVLINAFSAGALRVQQNPAQQGQAPATAPSSAKPSAIETDNADNVKPAPKKRSK